MFEIEEFLNSLENENTRLSHKSVLNKLSLYCKENNYELHMLNENLIVDFLKQHYSNRARKTQCCAISTLNIFFKYLNNPFIMSKVNLAKLSETSSPIDTKVYSPIEIEYIINTLENEQDKALICLLYYCNAWDKELNLIRNLKEEDISENSISLNGFKVSISDTVYNILLDACTNSTYLKYNPTRELSIYDSDYVIKTTRSTSKKDDRVALSTLKGRLNDIGKYIGSKGFTATAIKNSRLIYDIIRYEYDYNAGKDLTASQIKELFCGTSYKFSVESINPVKKKFKSKILSQITGNRDSECLLNGAVIKSEEEAV